MVDKKQSSSSLEQNTIQEIPLDQRHGKARDLFTLWFGGNLMLLTVVTGALSVTVFKQPFLYAVLGTVIGTLIGAVFMALHAAQGPQLGVPQMVQTRGQFGSIGSLLVICIVVVMYLGFFASNLVLAGQSLHGIADSVSVNDGVVLVGLLGVVGTIFGYRLLHTYAKIMTWCSGAAMVLAFVWVFAVHGLPADFLARNTFNATGFLATVSIAALWQIAYAPYVSDYSRYMPKDTGSKAAFWATYWGCSLGSIIPMVLGATLGLVAKDGDVVGTLVAYTGSVSIFVTVVFTLGIAAANSMNLYCGVLSTITIIQTLKPDFNARARGRAIAAFVLFGASLVLAIFGQTNFLPMYTNFILLLFYVLVPWTAVNLIDYYVLRHGEYDVDAFFRQDGGIYGKYNVMAIAAYLFGILIQIPFVATDMYTGSIAKKLGGADISWIVGIILTSVFYLFGQKLFAREPSRVSA
jgi:NCS1 family nucleobase:cation symporter-1